MKESNQTKLNFVRLNINLPKKLKDDFLTTAKLSDTDGSKLVRKWIKQYLKKNKE